MNPQKQKVSADLDQLFNYQSDNISQLEDDIKRINFKLIGMLETHGISGIFEYHGIQIEKNGIYSYKSI